MIKAINVAKYLLSLTDTEKGQVISNLALQKLLYYCQGYYLALTENSEALFPEDIVAWKFGPVVENVYYEYKKYGSGSIPVFESEELLKIIETLTKDQKDVIDSVSEAYKGFSAIALMEKTHQESPWMETELGSVISRDKIYNFFKGKIIR